MQKADKASSDSLYTIFDQVSDAVFVIDQDGLCVYQNHKSVLFPTKHLDRLIRLCRQQACYDKSPQIDLDNWKISISYLPDHMVLVCKNKANQLEQIRAMQQDFMVQLADNIPAQQAALRALRNHVDWRWMAICSLDHETKQFVFDLGFDGDLLNTPLFAPTKAAQEFSACSGLKHIANLQEIFADPQPFLDKGMGYLIGISIKNHVGKCVGYAMIGHHSEPEDAWEVGILLEVIAALYSPYFEANNAREEAEKAQQESLTDSVTGLGNRRACERFINDCLEEQHRERTSEAVQSMFDPHAMRNSVIMLSDFDGFKRLNDTMGHAEGDRALTLLGHCLREHKLPGNRIFRLGGDEFVQVFPRAGNLEAGDLRHWTTKIEQILQEAGFKDLGISIGVVHFFEGDGTYASLMALADARMYHDKKMRSLYLA
ncbi:MAG: GGDEF domain-containing protein [Cohaesibacter sp.]|nr:GGDEF domain-containing protein [Cohaesibacter sp.]